MYLISSFVIVSWKDAAKTHSLQLHCKYRRNKIQLHEYDDFLFRVQVQRSNWLHALCIIITLVAIWSLHQVDRIHITPQPAVITVEGYDYLTSYISIQGHKRRA